MQDFEKLGVFYLGREKSEEANLLLYNSKHLTTHGVIVGMTGSGKTGLAIDLIEEAAIDGVPSILIDPKGDLANILLQFPNLAPSDFRPWIDVEEAAREGLTPDAFAAKTAENWRTGLSKWAEDGERIRLLSRSADFAVYTPGDTTGRPLQILRSFDPPQGVDEITFRDTIVNNVSSLLGLVGVAADPMQSREHILLSSIFYSEWKAGRELDLARLIGFVANPPFQKVGVFDVESFYPSKDRMKLAMALNGLLASPSFASWREGEPLDIQRLLWTDAGKPRVSVLSIAHLSDAERMFFVTAVLNATLAWMRRQSGTGSLRALLYMDEIFGYFPPNANPPSKAPMLMLLKQARAFGLGIVLSTQNPVDLDYKGLSNCGTWFIGRLQTDRDKMRVLDGLESAAADSGRGFDRSSMDRLLSGLGKRVFLMRDAADDVPVLFETRWSMSYLCGPLSMAQIHSLIPAAAPAPAESAAFAPGMPSPFPPMESASEAAPSAAPSFAPAAAPAASATGFAMPCSSAKPRKIGASVRLHFVDAKTATDKWTSVYYLADADNVGSPDWEAAEEFDEPIEPSETVNLSEKRFAAWGKRLSSYVYQEKTVMMMRDTETKLVSKFGESEGDFRARLQLVLRERRDKLVDKVNATYGPKITRIEDQIRSAADRIQREKTQVSQKKTQTAVWAGAAILGAIFGRGRGITGSVSRAGSTIRSASGIGKEKQDVAMAEEKLSVLEERCRALKEEFEAKLAEAGQLPDVGDVMLEDVVIRPRKSDIIVESLFYV